MTIEGNVANWPEMFLKGWPGRFQHAQLVRRLHGDKLVGDPALHLLEGISASRTVDEVLEEFADRGEFQLAETLLAESDGVSSQVRARLADLEPLRAERASELVTRLRGLTDEASAAGVPFDVDAIDLEAQTRASWPAVEGILIAYREWIAEQIGSLRHALTARNQTDGTDPGLRAAVDSLIAAGRLALARRMLEGGTADLFVPEAQPALPTWRWSEPVATVLSWHVDPTRPKPPEFSAWRAPDESGQDLIEAVEALGGGGHDEARQFAAALERFLEPQAPPPVVHEFSGGWLSTVTLFRDAPLTSFRATVGVDLLILPPGVQSAPELPGVDNYLAVGPDLQPGGAFRTGAAVLTTVDTLRLATLSAGRAISLAQIVGPQWPLSALGAGTPASLARLLAEDPHHPWHRLGWLCSLAGLGGSATAEDLQFQGGDDTPVLHVLLMNLVDAVPASTHRGSLHAAGASAFRKRGSVGVEGVVLRDCPDPSIRAAFWATLMAAAPGTPLAFDSVCLAALLSSAGDDADWESVLAAGFGRLREQWFVDSLDVNYLSLRRLGVLTGLRSLAERRLAECAQELNAKAGEMPSENAETPTEWSVRRYALSEKWLADQQSLQFEADLNGNTDQVTNSEALIEAASKLSGSCDFAEVAGSLVAVAVRCFPATEFTAELPARTLVAVPERVLITVLYELLENAIEATERAGKVLISARVDGTDVIIDVFDDGPGLDSAISRAAQVFRPGFSTRSGDRGAGLHLARRITDVVRGELDVTDRSEGHPVFKGAHFTMILPRSS